MVADLLGLFLVFIVRAAQGRIALCIRANAKDIRVLDGAVNEGAKRTEGSGHRSLLAREHLQNTCSRLLFLRFLSSK